MIVEIENITTQEHLKDLLESIKLNQANRKKTNLSDFFGVLPNFGDGLEFQKNVRNKWN